MTTRPAQPKSRKKRRSGAINHQEAFADYVRLPRPERSYTNLAQLYVERKYYDTVATARSVIARWAGEHRWQERIEAAATEQSERELREAAELDANTYLRTSQELNRRAEFVDGLHMDELVRMRESVRKPAVKGTMEVTGKNGGPIQHDHIVRDMSAFTDDEMDALAELAERKKTEALS